jgi:hypothetical protein
MVSGRRVIAEACMGGIVHMGLHTVPLLLSLHLLTIRG